MGRKEPSNRLEGFDNNEGRKFKSNLRRQIENSDIEDGGTIILECSKCNEPLVEIIIIRPDVDIKTDIRATCGMCGDKSFIREIKGQYCLGRVQNGCVKVADVDINEVNYDEDGSIYQQVLATTEKRNKE